MSVWKKVKLGASCTKIGSGATPKGGATVYTNNGTSFIRSQNVYNLYFDYNGLTYISEEAADKLKGVSVLENDILLNITGDSVARTCIVPKAILPARVNQHVAIIRAKSELLNQRFLNYYLASPAMQVYMLNLAVGKGASRNAITKSMIENFEIPCPPLMVQCRIAEIISCYDSLIENYQKQIKLLEEATQRLYKEWFVDLRFPGYENTKIVDGVPEGWEKKEINEFISILSGYAFKSSSFVEDGDYKIVTIKNVQDGFFDGKNLSHIREIPSKMPKHCFLTTGDLLLSLTGNIGRVCMVIGNNCLLNQRVAKIESVFPAFAYCLFRSENMFTSINNLANGVAQQNVSPIKIGTLDIVVNNEIISKFEKVVGNIQNQILVLYSQIEELTEARDRLLPKLMSGEIEV